MRPGKPAEISQPAEKATVGTSSSVAPTPLAAIAPSNASKVDPRQSMGGGAANNLALVRMKDPITALTRQIDQLEKQSVDDQKKIKV